MKKEVYILLIFIFAIFILNYNFLDSAVVKFLDDSETVEIDRIIDGDTIVTSKNEHVRLLGINSPERGEKYYGEAKRFLEKEILNKTLRLEFVGEKQDKYYRTLAYIFLENENINIKMVENGFANFYFYSGRDKYSGELENAWNSCLEKEINLCKPSENVCAQCIEMNSKFIFNSCDFNCDINNWVVKTEGRDKVVFSGILNPGEKTEFDLDLSNSGGSLFLRDSEGDFVDWESY